MPPKRTIAHIGQNSVKVNINGDKRAAFTILATVSANGDRLPLVLFAKGKTMNYLKQFGVHPQHDYKIMHSKSGWMSEATFIEYLEWI